MPRNNPNSRERERAKKLATALGVSYQRALQILRGEGPPLASPGGPLERAGDAVTLAKHLLDNAARAQLNEVLADCLDENRPMRLDEFTPYDIVEGDIEENVLVAFDPGARPAAIVDAQPPSEDGRP